MTTGKEPYAGADPKARFALAGFWCLLILPIVSLVEVVGWYFAVVMKLATMCVGDSQEGLLFKPSSRVACALPLGMSYKGICRRFLLAKHKGFKVSISRLKSQDCHFFLCDNCIMYVSSES